MEQNDSYYRDRHELFDGAIVLFNDLSLHVKQFDVEDQRSVWGYDAAGAARTVAQFW